MARVGPLRERFDAPFFDTATVQDRWRFFRDGHSRDAPDRAVTNLRQGILQNEFMACGLGFRLLGVSRQEEELALDFMKLTLVVNDRPYGPYPAGLCSTFRMCLEDEDPGLDVRPMSPGYNFLSAVILPRKVRVEVHLGIDRGALWKEPSCGRVRDACVYIFGLQSRDC